MVVVTLASSQASDLPSWLLLEAIGVARIPLFLKGRKWEPRGSTEKYWFGFASGFAFYLFDSE